MFKSNLLDIILKHTSSHKRAPTSKMIFFLFWYVPDVRPAQWELGIRYFDLCKMDDLVKSAFCFLCFVIIYTCNDDTHSPKCIYMSK